jgi:Zn-dependent alcohol dehydrogenase
MTLPADFPHPLPTALIFYPVTMGFVAVFTAPLAGPGHSSRIFGTSCVGLCAIAATRVVGSYRIAAINR